MDLKKIKAFLVALVKSQNFKPMFGSLIVCILMAIAYISIGKYVHQTATANNNTTKTRHILTRLPGSRFGPIVKAQDPTNGSSALGDSISQMDRTSKTPSFSEKVHSMWKGTVPINEKDANVKSQASANSISALGGSIPQMDRTSKTPSFSKRVYSMVWKDAAPVPINEKDANSGAEVQTNGVSAFGDRYYRSQEARRLRFG